MVASAHMHGDGHIVGNVGHRRVDEGAVELGKPFRVVATVGHLLAVFGIAQHGDKHLVELQIAAAGIGERPHRLAVGLAEIVEHLLTREGRSIPIVAYLPETSSALPLIVFTPGFQVASSSYTPMLERLANEGYNVVRADPPGTPFDVNHIEMATDIRAVIDWLLSADCASSIDGSKIATMGHSLGGKIALFNAARDSRVVATFAIDPVDGDPSPIPDPMARPTLAPDVISEITGAVGLVGELTNGESSNPFAPACAPLANNFQTIFEALVNASWVVEWELIGADHMDFVNECPQGLFSPCSLCAEGTMNPDQVRELTTQFASDFFGLHLRDETHREVNLTMSSSADVRVRTR